MMPLKRLRLFSNRLLPGIYSAKARKNAGRFRYENGYPFFFRFSFQRNCFWHCFFK